MKQTDPLSIREIIDKVLDQEEIRSTALNQRACYLWPEIVGAGINRYTTRRYVSMGVMHVFISSAPLKNELMFHRGRLVEQINKAVGTNVITEIVIH